MITRRYLTAQVEADLDRKMVFVAGPRQVGKTTLARSLPEAEAGYLNWDVPWSGSTPSIACRPWEPRGCGR